MDNAVVKVHDSSLGHKRYQKRNVDSRDQQQHMKDEGIDVNE
jgi:hypothetical protein